MAVFLLCPYVVERELLCLSLCKRALIPLWGLHPHALIIPMVPPSHTHWDSSIWTLEEHKHQLPTVSHISTSDCFCLQTPLLCRSLNLPQLSAFYHYQLGFPGVSPSILMCQLLTWWSYGEQGMEEVFRNLFTLLPVAAPFHWEDRISESDIDHGCPSFHIPVCESLCQISLMLVAWPLNGSLSYTGEASHPLKPGAASPQLPAPMPCLWALVSALLESLGLRLGFCLSGNTDVCLGSWFVYLWITSYT